MLTAERVESLYHSCLKGKSSGSGNIVPLQLVNGIMSNTLFDQDRIKEHKKEIYALLKELPDTYLESGGGGMSFLGACYDRHGVQWTGMQVTMDRLFQLGIAIGKVEYVFDDRSLWPILPGGVPYLIIKDQEHDND